MNIRTEELLCEAASYKSNACAKEYDTALENNRPFMLLKPRMYPDGNQWCALYGDNIQEGVCGFGDTPHKASIAFDLAWLNETLPAVNDTKGGK